MINGVEGSGQIKKNKGGNFFMITGIQKVIVDRKKGSLRGMEFPVSRLEGGKRRKGVKMGE